MFLDLGRLITLGGYAIALVGVIPLFPHVPLLPRLVFVAGVCAGIMGDRRGFPLVPGPLLTAASILLFFWYATQFSRHNPVLPVVSILVVLVAARLVGEKNPRAWLQSCAIALFALSSSSLFDLGPRFLLLLGLMLPLLAMMLVLLTFQARDVAVRLDRPALRQVIAVGLLIPLFSLVLVPVFFPVLPRTQLPLWSFLQQAGGSSSTGLADTVAPGMAAAVPENGPLAFRAESIRLAPAQLYWRGAVFSRIHDLRWQRDAGVQSVKSDSRQQLIDQVITMEPGSSRMLIGLDLPVSFSHPGGSVMPNATWNRPLPSSRRLRYEVRSLPPGDGSTALAPPSRALLTALPVDLPSRLKQLVLQFRQQGNSDRQRLDAVTAWFRSNNFSYSRTGLPTGAHALEQFLFESRSGHCEFFASAFALLLRGADLPTRLVGGYLGGVYNELGGYYRITEDRAHVWVEVWLEKEGWLRIDPSSFAVNADMALGGQRQLNFTTQARLLLDALEYTWNSAVITYDFERQLEVVNKTSARLQSFPLRNARWLGGATVAVVSLVFGAWFCSRYSRAGYFSRESRILRRFNARTRCEFGVVCESQAGLFDVADRTKSRWVRMFVELYAGVLYRDRRLTAKEYGKLKELLDYQSIKR